MYNRVNFIRVFLQKRALPSMRLTWISLLKKVKTIHTFLFHFFFSGPSTLPEEELGYLWKPHRYATAGTFVSCHSRSVHSKNFFMKKHKEIQYPVCTAVFDLNLLLQYVALTAWGHLHPTYICANKCPFAFGFPYDLSLLPHSASRPPQIGWWWIGKKKKKIIHLQFHKEGRDGNAERQIQKASMSKHKGSNYPSRDQVLYRTSIRSRVLQ